MLINQDDNSSIEMIKLELIEKIRVNDHKKAICVPELIFKQVHNANQIMPSASRLNRASAYLRNHPKIWMVYTTNVGLSVYEALNDKYNIFKDVSLNEMCSGIANLVRTYYKISNSGITHRDIRSQNVTFKIYNENKVSFSLIDFGCLLNLIGDTVDEKECTAQRVFMDNIRVEIPIERYFFEIILCLFIEMIRKNQFTLDTSILNVYANRTTQRSPSMNQNINNLLVSLDNVFKYIYTEVDVNSIWQKCCSDIHASIDDETKNCIFLNQDDLLTPYNMYPFDIFKKMPRHDMMFTKFCKIYYRKSFNTQKKDKNVVVVRNDQHALGVIILMLLQSQRMVDTNMYNTAIELAKDLMMGRGKMSTIHRGFSKLGKMKMETSKLKQNQLDLGMLNQCYVSAYRQNVQSTYQMPMQFYGFPQMQPMQQQRMPIPVYNQMIQPYYQN
jgi:serine/threonine protein kinase